MDWVLWTNESPNWVLWCCHGNKPEQENCQYLDGCHDFCAAGEGGYLNTAVKCSLDTSEFQNFIVEPGSADDEKPVWNFLCLRGKREGRGEGEGEGRERGKKGRKGKKGGEGGRREAISFFPM